jgi:hypothetical protein
MAAVYFNPLGGPVERRISAYLRKIDQAVLA